MPGIHDESHLDDGSFVEVTYPKEDTPGTPKAPDKSLSYATGLTDGVAALQNAIKIGAANPIRPTAVPYVVIPWTTDPVKRIAADNLRGLLVDASNVAADAIEPIDAKEYVDGYTEAWREAGRDMGYRGNALWPWVDLPPAPVAEEGSVFVDPPDSNAFDSRQWENPNDTPEQQRERIKLKRATFRHLAQSEVYKEEFHLFIALAYGHKLGLNDAKEADEQMAREGASKGHPEERPMETVLRRRNGSPQSESVVELVRINSKPSVGDDTHIGIDFMEYVEPANRIEYLSHGLVLRFKAPLVVECPITEARSVYLSANDIPIGDVPCSCGKPGCFYVKWADKPAFLPSA